MRILFILGRYMPKPSANGACVYHIQEELKMLGVESDVVVDRYEETVKVSPYGKVYQATFTDPQKNATSLLRKIKAMLFYPIYYPQDIFSYRQAIKKAVEENEYDAIVSVLTPCNGALAAKIYNNVLVYELDSLTNNVINESGFRKFLKHRVRWVEHVLYKNANYIFHMISHKHFYDKKTYKYYSKKSEYLDIPQLVNEYIEDRVDKNHKVIKIIYSGILQREMRSPAYSIRLFKELVKQENKDYEISFYSRGDCEDMIAVADKETSHRIQQKGYVTLEELNMAVGETDFLLSIGNKMPGVVTSLPSKVISYMAYGKPIIHIDAGKNDVAKEYLNKYPLALIINPEEDFMGNVERLKCFIEENLDSRVPFEEVKQKFPLNTPGYTAKRMIEVIETHCCGKVYKK